MKNTVAVFLLGTVLALSCSKRGENPFFSAFDTPHGVPPFSQVRIDHYIPAFEEGIERHKTEIAAIADNPEAPTFENTIEALEMSGEMLDRVENVFYAMNGSMTNDRMQAIAKEVAPMRSAHYDEILLNADLFERVKTVYGQKDQLDLTTEQQTVLDRYYKDFVRGGALLNDEDKAKMKAINQELSVLSVQFGENILKETNKWEMVVEDEADLAGLPENVISAAAEAAKERGDDGKWVFTIHKPSMIPFLQYSARRDLREKIFKAFINQGNNDDELDNKAVLAKIASLRLKRANLLGYDTHADFILEERMAKESKNVYDLLNRLWKPALKRAGQEARDMEAMIEAEGGGFELQPWDWWYYAEKVKKAKYDLDEEMLRPYFKLENVIKGAFYVAGRLWGLHFIERNDIPTYHEDAKVYEVEDADGSHLGILYMDYFPRESKRGGAWCGGFQGQRRVGGEVKYAIITNNGNFTKPTGEKPSLLSFDEVETLFHEFGHALHGLLQNITYPRAARVAWDFVELPSQIMEHWAAEPEVMKVYARHYETDEPIPDALIKKIEKSGYFNQGFVTVEYLASSFLDMDWHTITDTEEREITLFEKTSMDKIGLIPEIVPRWRSTYFAHIFSGGYSAGYYSYIWAEVLDCDAFEAFKETSLFDQKTARSLRENILSRGGSEDPMVLYKRFRGREPKVEPILKKRGLM